MFDEQIQIKPKELDLGTMKDCFSQLKTSSDSIHASQISLSFSLKCKLESQIKVKQIVFDQKKSVQFTGILGENTTDTRLEATESIYSESSNVLQSKLQLIDAGGVILLNVFTDLQFNIITYNMQWLDTICVTFTVLTILIILGIVVYYWIRSSQIKKQISK